MNSDREGYDTPEYRAWRYAVFARDNWTCQLTGQKGCELEAHHIIKWANAPHLRYAVSNGITLSKDSHGLVTGREEEFQEQFQRIIATKKGQLKKVHGNKGKIRSVGPKFKWRPRDPRLRYG
jgi:5-methylcytosine-specific restriction endonuclease McrA